MRVSSKSPLWLIFSLLLICQISRAGVTNPDVSALGQMRTFVTDDTANINRNRGQISFDESEIVFDAALNPYAHGTFVFSILDGEIEVEEGYLLLTKGLPQGFGIKAGKYRVGFGKLNPLHAHAYPFIERFRVLAAYLPGEESFNEIGGQLSYRLPLPIDLSSTFSVDVLQGNSFHPDESEQSRPALLGRWSNFFMLNDESSMEIGLSATQGINNVAMKTRTSVFGMDAKAKLWFSPLKVLVLQGELLGLDREDATLDTLTGIVSKEHVRPFGGYIFADYTTQRRYNFGAKYERFQRPEVGKPWDQSVGAFAGFALMEETTLFRLNWDRFLPKDGDAYNTFTLQVVFSMGPHKAHQF
jgi:hypothetical protein